MTRDELARKVCEVFFKDQPEYVEDCFTLRTHREDKQSFCDVADYILSNWKEWIPENYKISEGHIVAGILTNKDIDFSSGKGILLIEEK